MKEDDYKHIDHDSYLENLKYDHIPPENLRKDKILLRWLYILLVILVATLFIFIYYLIKSATNV